MNTLLPISPTNRRGPIPSLARIATVLTLGFAVQAQAADYTWVQDSSVPGTSTWGTQAAYDPQPPTSSGPGASDNLTIIGTKTINLSSGTTPREINNLTASVSGADISGGGSGGGTLIVFGDVAVDSGASLSLRNGNSTPGNFDIRGDIDISSGATLNLGTSISPTANNSNLNSFQVSSTSSITVSGNLFIQKQPSSASLGDLIVNNGGMVNLARTGSNNQDITKTINARSLSGSGEIEVNGVATTGGTGTATLLVTTANTTNANFSGVLGNGASAGQSLALTIAGSGTQTLSGTNTYTGATLVSAGTLLVNGSISSSSGVSVSSGATLGGSGSVAAISGAGTVGPGNSPGILTAPSVDGSGGLDFSFEFTGLAPDYDNATASVNDVLRLTSGTPFAFALDGDNQITVDFSALTPAAGTYYGGFYADSENFLLDISGAAFQFVGLGGFTVSNINVVQQDADFGSGVVNGYVTAFTLDVIPEPGSTALLLFGGLGLLSLRARRRASRLTR